MLNAASDSLEIGDPWHGLVHFLEHALELQVEDRALKELLLSTSEAHARIERARSKIEPVAAAVLERAQQAGVVRADIEVSDLLLLQHAIGEVADYTREAAPEVWRRTLTIALDGLRPDRRRPSPMPSPALDDEQIVCSMRDWGSRRRRWGGPRPRPRRRALLRASPCLAPDPRALGIDQRLACEDARHPHPEDVDLDGGLELDLGGEVGIGDRTLHRVAVAAAGHASDHLAVHPQRLVAQRDRAGIPGHKEAQALSGPLRTLLRANAERGRADERALLLHAEAEAGLIGGLVGGDVCRPYAVALLQPQRVDRAVAARREPVLAPGLPQGPPQPRPVLRRAVELPTELAHEGHAQGAHGHVPYGQLPHAHVGELQRVVGQRGEDLAGARAPQREARPAGRHVGAADAAVAGGVAADPAEVVVAERRPGHDREELLLHARDREVELDSAAAVEHLRVGDRADLARHAVVAEPFQEGARAGPGDLELGERGLVEQARALARG